MSEKRIRYVRESISDFVSQAASLDIIFILCMKMEVYRLTT